MWTRGGARLALAFVSLALATACGRSEPRMPAGYIQVDIENSPLSSDPRYATDAISSRVNELAFDAMVRVDSNGQFVPNLAASIERPAPAVLVFHLRRGVRFCDGRELTARDVKFTYDSILAPSSMSAKRASLARLAEIDAPDDQTVVMTTRGPYAPALELAMQEIVPAGTPPPAELRAPAPPGTGPFRIVSVKRDEAVVLERNRYRTALESAPRGIVFKVVPDPTVRALELEEGSCDFSENNIQADLLPYLGGIPGLAISKSAGSSYQYLSFNFRDARLRDVRVRRAIAYAIDRDALLASYLRGTGRPATGMLAPENWAYEGAVEVYNYDPARAAKLLDEAGYPANAGGMRALSLVYNTTPEGARLGEAIQAMLRRVGVTIQIRTNEFATFYGDIQRGNFDLTSMKWVGINDPNHYYMVFDSKMTPPAGYNRGAYSNPAMDRLVEAGAVTLDPAERKRIYSRVQEIAARDLPYVSLWWNDNVAVMSRRITGFTPHPNGSLISLGTVSLIGPGGGEPSR
jgi:peptide/nickel transport system substrate-binding protein